MVNAISDWHVWAWSGGVVVGAILIAALGYRILFRFLNRLAGREGELLVDSLVHRAKAVPLENPERSEPTRIMLLCYSSLDACSFTRTSRHLAFAHPFTC